MTAIVGILCENGVAIGTDSSVTFGSGGIRTIEQTGEKLTIIGGKVIVVGTGQVGLEQRFKAIVQKAWDSGVFNQPALQVSHTLCRSTIEDFSQTKVQQNQFGALIGFHAEGRFQLCEFAVQDFQPEFKKENMWYCSMGSTQHITDSFLALLKGILWVGGSPSINDGVFAATWVLDHAIEVNTGGVNGPVQLATLQYDSHGEVQAEIKTDDQLQEHRQNIGRAKDSLREYCMSLTVADSSTPDVPRPS